MTDCALSKILRTGDLESVLVFPFRSASFDSCVDHVDCVLKGCEIVLYVVPLTHILGVLIVIFLA